MVVRRKIRGVSIVAKIPTDQDKTPMHRSWNYKETIVLKNTLISNFYTDVEDTSNTLRLDIQKEYENQPLLRARLSYKNKEYEVIEEMEAFMSDNTPDGYNRYILAKELIYE